VGGIYALIADDLTGAGDSGAQFARNGLSTRVLFGSFGPAEIGGADILVINTDSRFLPPDDAGRAVASATEQLKKVGAIPFFKKIDSTMRGQIGKEIDTIMDIEGQKAAIFCPSFPANGRIVLGGHLLVEGQPVARSAAGNDPVTPVKISHIPTLLRQQSIRHIVSCMIDDLNPPTLRKVVEEAKHLGSIVVCDAVTDEDLELIAEIGISEIGNILLVGSAGLANPVAKRLAKLLGRYQTTITTSISIIIAVGSVNPVAREQLEYLLKSGSAELILLDLENLFGSNSDLYLKSVVAECMSICERGHYPAVASPGGKDDVEEARKIGKRLGLNPIEVSSRISRALGYVVHEFAENMAHASIVATGGDIARAILEEFGCSSLDIIDEVAPGIPICTMHGGKMPGVKMITKAGGFGRIDALSLAVDMLARGDVKK